MGDIYHDPIDSSVAINPSSLVSSPIPPPVTTELARRYSPLLLASGAVMQMAGSTTVGTTPTGVCVVANGNIYVCNFGSLTISVLSPLNYNVINTIIVASAPRHCCFNPVSNRVYVTTNSSALLVIDPDANGGAGQQVGTITIPYTGGTQIPMGLCWCPSNNQIYVGYSGSAAAFMQLISAMTSTSGTVTALSTSMQADQMYPFYVPSVDKVWVGRNVGASQQITIITCGATPVYSSAPTASVPIKPSCGVYCPITDRVYISHFDAGTVAIYNPNTPAWQASISLSSSRPLGLAYNPDNLQIYIPCDVSASGGSVSILNPGGAALNSYAPIVTTSTTKPVFSAYSPHTGFTVVTQSDGKLLWLS